MLNRILLITTILLLTSAFFNKVNALDIENVGTSIFNSALINISPIGNKADRPDAGIIFKNFKINTSVYSECRGTPKEFLAYYNQLAGEKLFSNLDYSKDEVLQQKARVNIVGILVCIEVSSQYLIFESSEHFHKLKTQIMKLNHVPTGFSLMSNREILFREITWRILLNNYLNGDEFSLTMLLSMVQTHMYQDSFKDDKAWLSKIYSDLVLNYMELYGNSRGSSRIIIGINVNEAIKNSLQERDYDKAKKIIFLDREFKYLSDEARADFTRKLYFSENEKNINYLKLLFEKIVLALAKMSFVGKICILLFLYLIGFIIKVKQLKKAKFWNRDRREKMCIFFHPLTYYFLNNHSPLYKIIHTVFIFYSFSVFNDYVSMIESDILKNVYWFGF